MILSNCSLVKASPPVFHGLLKAGSALGTLGGGGDFYTIAGGRVSGFGRLKGVWYTVSATEGVSAGCMIGAVMASWIVLNGA